jgi:hypothetical protein
MSVFVCIFALANSACKLYIFWAVICHYHWAVSFYSIFQRYLIDGTIFEGGGGEFGTWYVFRFYLQFLCIMI